MTTSQQTKPPRTLKRVVACYSVLDRFMPTCGFSDFTDGMYEGDPERPYELAQDRQAEVLLDRAGCQSKSRLLDIGCGYGRILRAARERGAQVIGLSVSPEQVRDCCAEGLDVRLIDYRGLDNSWNDCFDMVIANGSLEHFAQPSDALENRDDEVYRTMFQKVCQVLDKTTSESRFVTTAIHFRHRPDPRDLLSPASKFPPGSKSFHWARISSAFGGWYPIPGQLERCAQGLFKLVQEEDGTADYHITSEAWLRGVRTKLRFPYIIWVALRSVPIALRQPFHLVSMLRCLLGSESWNWQFRGDPSPTLLLRQTWRRL